MKEIIVLSIIVLFICGSCSSTRYLTDETSIKRQREMKANRTGGNIGDVLINFVNLFVSASLNSSYEVYASERAFKRITIANESEDSLYVNMVTDVMRKNSDYCDIMGIVLPARARQKVLAPFPAAYNVYFRKPGSDEEILEIRTDGKFRVIRLKPGMTKTTEIPAEENK